MNSVIQANPCLQPENVPACCFGSKLRAPADDIQRRGRRSWRGDAPWVPKSQGGPINLTLVNTPSAISTKVSLCLYPHLLPPEQGGRDLIPLAGARKAHREHLWASLSSCDCLATREVCMHQQDWVQHTLLPPSRRPGPTIRCSQAQAKGASPTSVRLGFNLTSQGLYPSPATGEYRGVHPTKAQAKQPSLCT